MYGKSGVAITGIGIRAAVIFVIWDWKNSCPREIFMET